MLIEIQIAVEEIRQKKYPQAQVVFLAGSFVRGEDTSTSDLDLVVLFDHIPFAYRESFVYTKWPVEAFVHDPQTLEYFFREVDRPTGIPSLPAMVAEGIEIPQKSEFSESLKRLAVAVLDEGPPKWSDIELSNSRYAITDLIEDLKDPKSKQELNAAATVLYSTLANHYFRSRSIWSAKGKTIPRRLNAVDSCLAGRYQDSFDKLFSEKDSAAVIELAREILEPDGGSFFEGHKLEAPKSWRVR